MAAMSVIGIDLGNESCYIAVAKAGGIETIANDYSLRSTPSYVAFSGKNRILGVAAKNQQVTNMKNTVYGLKRLLGRKFRDPQVQKELKMLPYAAVEGPNGDIQIQVNYLDEEHHFSPEQCLAMVFTKLKEVSADALQTPINDCVISVPSYFTNNERRALLDSATVAGLNVLRLFNETTATALSYGIYKQDLPGTEEKPRHVIFVDCGQSSLQVFACAFHKGKLRMLATSSDRDLGGRDIDYVLADHIAKDFQVKYKIDAKSNARAYVRLLAEVEKLKKQMSANSTTLPLNIECFMNDKDVHSEMKRADMELLCGHMFDRVELVLTDCLKKSGLALDDIYAVEVVGGSTRIPFIKQLIEKVYKKVASTTLNQDESVSRGCALQCAMLSPAVRVRDFSVTDVQSYPVIVSWDSSRDGEQSGEIEVFPLNHAVPFSKMLTFYRQESFELRATYNCPIPYPDPNIGTWIIKDVKPSAEGKAQKVKVKVRINLNGIITVSSASLVESKDSSGSDSNGAGQPMDGLETSGATDGTAGDKDGGSNHTGEGTGDSGTGGEKGGEKGSDGATAAAEGTEANTTEATAEEGEDKKDKKKKVSKSTDLPIEAILFGYSQSEINGFTEQEFKMIAGDRQEKERADARNALEEYVYELRGKLSGEDELAPFLLESDRDLLIRQLEDMENWLYEEGEDCSRAVYQEKLADLKGKGEPIQLRRLEFELRPPVIEGFQRSLQLANKAVEQIRSNEAKYAHLTEDEAAQVAAQVTSSYQWLEETRQKIVAAPKHLSPPVTVAQIRHERQSFESATNQILNKPAPKAASPPKDAKPAAASADEQSTNQDNSDASKSQDKMDTS